MYLEIICKVFRSWTDLMDDYVITSLLPRMTATWDTTVGRAEKEVMQQLWDVLAAK